MIRHLALIITLMYVIVAFDLSSNEKCNVCGVTEDSSDDDDDDGDGDSDSVDLRQLLLSVSEAVTVSKDQGTGYRASGAMSPMISITEGSANDKNIEMRVVDGDDVNPGKYPWAVSIASGGQVASCGGAVIAASYVLTAAHCLSKEPGNSEEGTQDADDLNVQLWHEKSKPTQQLDVEEVHVHPKFFHDEDNFEHDIGILKLKEKLECDEMTSPICIPKSSLEKETETMIVTGWGAHENGEQPVGDEVRLREGEVKWTKAKHCIKNDSDPHAGVSTGPVKSLTCAVATDDKPQIPCQGDSGSALFQEIEGVWYALGVVSSIKDGNCVKEAKQTYMKPSYYRKWIKKIVGKLPKPP